MEWHGIAKDLFVIRAAVHVKRIMNSQKASTLRKYSLLMLNTLRGQHLDP